MQFETWVVTIFVKCYIISVNRLKVPLQLKPIIDFFLSFFLSILLSVISDHNGRFAIVPG